MGNTASVKSNLKFKIIDNKSDTERLLQDAENVDFYLAECHDDRSNSYARRSLTYAPNRMSHTDLQSAQLQLDQLLYQIPKRLLDDIGTVNIIQLMPTADGGMPHTRPGNIICYPDISRIASVTTLIHELWHIHQRNYQDLWTTIFNKLGWSEWDGRLPMSLDKHRRYNPDTIDAPLWIFQKRWVPIPIFKHITLPVISDVDIWYYDIKEEYHVKDIPEKLNTYFPGVSPSAYEHPRELTAYMLSEPDRYKSSPAFIDLLKLLS